MAGVGLRRGVVGCASRGPGPCSAGDHAKGRGSIIDDAARSAHHRQITGQVRSVISSSCVTSPARIMPLCPRASFRVCPGTHRRRRSRNVADRWRRNQSRRPGRGRGCQHSGRTAARRHCDARPSGPGSRFAPPTCRMPLGQSQGGRRILLPASMRRRLCCFDAIGNSYARRQCALGRGGSRVSILSLRRTEFPVATSGNRRLAFGIG